MIAHLVTDSYVILCSAYKVIQFVIDRFSSIIYLVALTHSFQIVSKKRRVLIG